MTGVAQKSEAALGASSNIRTRDPAMKFGPVELSTRTATIH